VQDTIRTNIDTDIHDDEALRVIWMKPCLDGPLE
jgi:hypothetical protein